MDPVVLFFILGVVARLAKSDLRLPEALYETLSIYLLLAIGLKGVVQDAYSIIQDIMHEMVHQLIIVVGRLECLYILQEI